jgi:hypothetical protein
MSPLLARKASASPAVRPVSLGKWTSRKLPTLGVTASPESSISRASQGSQRSLWAIAAARCASSAAAGPPPRDAGGYRRAVDVEGAADAVHRVDHMGRADHPAEAQAGEPVDLRKGAGHDDVLGVRHELQPRPVIVAPHVLGIGCVEDEKRMLRQAGMEALDLVERQVGPGRVVGVRQENDLRPRPDGGEKGVHVRPVVPLFRHHRRAAGREDGDAIDEKAVSGEHALVARADEGVGDERQKLVRAGAADDPGGVEPVAGTDRLAQGGCAAVGVDGEPPGRLPRCLGRPRARAERCLVR